MHGALTWLLAGDTDDAAGPALSRSLRGHAAIDIAQSRRGSFPVQGNYMALDGIPGNFQLRNSALFYPVM